MESIIKDVKATTASMSTSVSTAKDSSKTTTSTAKDALTSTTKPPMSDKTQPAAKHV